MQLEAEVKAKGRSEAAGKVQQCLFECRTSAQASSSIAVASFFDSPNDQTGTAGSFLCV